MEQPVKLTVRLPHNLHKQLKDSAQLQTSSLNKIIVNTLWLGLRARSYTEQNGRHQALRTIRESGYWGPPGPGWNKYTDNVPDISHEELRKQLTGIPPLSETIIEEREPR